MHNTQETHRVVITGLGVMTTLGQNLTEYYDALMKGQSGIRLWSQINCLSKVGGDMSDFDIIHYIKSHAIQYPFAIQKTIKTLLPGVSLSANLTALASLQACREADFFAHYSPEKKCHILAGHNIANNYEYINVVKHHQGLDVDTWPLIKSKDEGVLALIDNLLRWEGLSFCMIGACSSSNMALFNAFDKIRYGSLSAVLISGASNDLSPIILDAWAKIGVISTQSFNNCPAEASRPFDKKREGFLPSHGSAAVVLENFSSAKKRGAKIYGEILGASNCMNASRLPKPCLKGMVRSIKAALCDAKLVGPQIDYISAHATSTPLGDKLEVAAIKEVFADHAYKMPVNATKSMLGHCLTAAGTTGLIAILLQLMHNTVHPTINQQNEDPELNLNFVPNHGIDYKMKIALANSFGFGGYNSTIIVAKI